MASHDVTNKLSAGGKKGKIYIITNKQPTHKKKEGLVIYIEHSDVLYL